MDRSIFEVARNDLKHATILSQVIPRFIQRSLERNRENQDPYHPRIDAQRLAGFLDKEPWKDLIPKHEREAMLEACRLASGDTNAKFDPLTAAHI